MKQIFLITIVVCFFFSMQTEGQKRQNGNDIRVVKNRPSIYISFEREGLRESPYVDESNQRIWLQFHNNSKWKVGTCMSLYPNRKGGNYPDKIFYYDVERIEGAESPKDIPIGNPMKGGCHLVFIKSGGSEVFSVPREHLIDGLLIKVNFTYEWDIEPDGSISDLEPKHYVYFYSSDIPKK